MVRDCRDRVKLAYRGSGTAIGPPRPANGPPPQVPRRALESQPWWLGTRPFVIPSTPPTPHTSPCETTHRLPLHDRCSIHSPKRIHEKGELATHPATSLTTSRTNAV